MDAALDNSTEVLLFEFSDYTQRVIVATMILIISVIGIIGNTMVQLATMLSKKLRTATNAFVVNLSIADLLTCLVMPWNAVALLGMDGLLVGEWVCKIVAIIQFTTVGCSIFTLACIGLNRLLLITRPTTTYHNMYSSKKIPVWMIFTWLIPMLVGLIPPLVDVGAVGYNKQYHFCGSLPSHPLYNTYNIIIAAALYPIPLITIIISYSLIWRHLHRHSIRLVKPPTKPDKYTPTNTFALSNSRDIIINSDETQLPSTSSPSRSASKRQIAVTKNMMYVVCGFGVCLTPYAINLTFAANSPFIPYTTAILLLNNCINPLIYATKHRDFKTVFGCILRCQWYLIPEPSNFLKALR